MAYLKKTELERGIKTIKALREAARNNEMVVTKTVDAYQPKHRSSWSMALRDLGVIRKHKHQDRYDASYWNQDGYSQDYDLLIAIMQNIEERFYKLQNKQEVAQQSKEKPYISFDHLSMTKAEYDTLVKSYNKAVVDDIINRIKNYKKKHKYVSLYLTAKNWIENDYRKSFSPLFNNSEFSDLAQQEQPLINVADDKVYSISEAAQILKVKERAVQRRCKRYNVAKKNGAYVITNTMLNKWKGEDDQYAEEPQQTTWLKIFGIKIYEKPVTSN